MIVKIIKKLYNEQKDYTITSETGEVLCKVAKLKKGYYIYNKAGEQIAQITYYNNYAILAVANKKGSFPGSIKMSIKGDGFAFSTNEIEKGDQQYLENIKGKQGEEYSIWGDTEKYAYDIYRGSTMVASVAPSSKDSSYYSVMIRPKGNFLVIIMIALASEKLNYDPKGKF